VSTAGSVLDAAGDESADEIYVNVVKRTHSRYELARDNVISKLLLKILFETLLYYLPYFSTFI